MITLEDLDRIDDAAELFVKSTAAMAEYQGAIDKLAVIRARCAAALHLLGVSNRSLGKGYA